MKPTILAWAFPLLLAAQTAPTAYTIVQVNSMMGTSVTMTVYRDGNKALIDNRANGTHVRALYDLGASSNKGWDADKPDGCSGSKISGDWGDPFEMSKSLMADVNAQNPKEVGAETLNGFRTKVIETKAAKGNGKVWIEPQTGLIIKAVSSEAGKPPQTLLETKSFTSGKPASSIFQLPASCSNAPVVATPQPVTPANPDFVSAIRAGQMPSEQSCNVVIRILKAETFEPVTGLQVSVNLQVDINNLNAPVPPGAIRQLTRPYRVDNAPPVFDVQVRFPDGGQSGALIYRQCFSQRTVLLVLLKNPAVPTDGVEWQWAKSGKLSQ